MNSIQTDAIDELYVDRNSTIAKDLKLNLKRVLQEGSLKSEDALLVLLAVAATVEHRALAEFARAGLQAQNFSPEQIGEAAESAAIMGMLNNYYRFRHIMGKDEDYKTAGLRMTSLARPVLGKDKFEMLALAVSILNGCETCIRSHEKVVAESLVGHWSQCGSGS